jgi:putative transcriptional regulator
MSESNIVRVRSLPDGSVVQVMPDGSTQPIEDRTDWARLEAMTEEEIEANALSDPDNPPLTDEELARMRRVPDPERIRTRLGLTQAEFADQFEISIHVLRAWEQRERWLDTAAITLLRIIEQDPDGVRAALRRTYEPRLRPTGD